MDTALVLCGGDGAPTRAFDIPPNAYVVAADSGLHLAPALGVRVDVVVGDLDSVDPRALGTARLAGTAVDEYPAEKDATDLELALLTAIEHGVSRIVVVGGAGGRYDHLLGNLTAIASPVFAAVAIEAHIGPAFVQVTHGRPIEVRGAPRELVSLIPMWGPARGITTTGLQYPLRGEDLALGTSRGISNVLLEPVATVTLASGTLLVVQPNGDPA